MATLNGLVTNDISTLQADQGAYAAILTPKGKVVADLRIFRRDSGFLIDTSPLAAPGLQEMLKKYVNPRLATITDLTADLSDIGIFGASATEILATVTETSLETLAALDAYDQFTVETPDGPVVIARVPDLGVLGYELFLPTALTTQVYDALAAAGATPADANIWHTLRIAAGRPEWGLDIDENTLLQEANFDTLNGVSYDKGCYVGQETVARIHFRGHVNKNLRQLSIPADIAPPRGAELIDDAGKSVGDVRSTARHSDHILIGLGMVRREIADGAALTARWDGGEVPVQVIGSPQTP